MDEYIKREDAMKALDEYRLSHTMSMHGDMELLMEFRDGVVGAMNALAFVPAADVVPKSEYDAVVSAVDNSTKEFLKLHDDYQEAKREVDRLKYNLKATLEEIPETKADVAREIFEELLEDSFDQYGHFDYNMFFKIKKKYTEEQV